MTILSNDLDLAVTWHPVCDLARLIPDRGVAALVADEPVAIFLLASGELRAIGNIDPCSGANVMSRGIVGDAGGVTTVASPMFKHRFDLHTGECLDDPDARADVHHVMVIDGVVHVAATT